MLTPAGGEAVAEEMASRTTAEAMLRIMLFIVIPSNNECSRKVIELQSYFPNRAMLTGCGWTLSLVRVKR